LSSDIVRMDGLLRRYGPETAAIRTALQRYTGASLEDLFSNGGGTKQNVDNPATAKLLDDVQDRILALTPADDRQRWLSAQALQLAADLSAASSLVVQENVSSLPFPFLGAVLIWLTVLFASFGVFAPGNVTTVVALFLCAFAVSSAVKLVLDLDTPFDREIHVSPPPIHISSDPLRHAMQAINR